MARTPAMICCLLLGVAGCGDDAALAVDGATDALGADAPPSDRPAPDAAPDASCTAPLRFTVQAEADTILASGAPDFNYGTGPVANVGTGIGSVGLFRFDLTALPTTAQVQAARVEFAFAATSSSCAPSCASCLGIEHSGNFALFYLRSDWIEAQATWNRPQVGLAWGAAGASQPGIDRSVLPVATFLHQPGTGQSIALDPTSLDGVNGVWRRSNRVSFELVPSNFGVYVIATRESSAEACVPGGYAHARLSVDYCP